MRLAMARSISLRREGESRVKSGSFDWNESAGVWVGYGPAMEPKTVLVIVAHPDDLELQAGALVARMSANGSVVHLVCCTSGDRGSNDRRMTSSRLAAIREEEQREAAALLGISSVEFLGWPDGDVGCGTVLREEIVRRIRTHRPQVVITHDPVHPWPEYTAHRDHRNVGRTTLDALYPDARDHLAYPEHLDEGLEPHITREAWLIMSNQPDWFVDVGESLDLKIQARLCHRSQTGDSNELSDRYRERATRLGAQVGLAYAEALKRIEFG